MPSNFFNVPILYSFVNNCMISYKRLDGFSRLPIEICGKVVQTNMADRAITWPWLSHLLLTFIDVNGEHHWQTFWRAIRYLRAEVHEVTQSKNDLIWAYNIVLYRSRAWSNRYWRLVISGHAQDQSDICSSVLIRTLSPAFQQKYLILNCSLGLDAALAIRII